MRTMHQTTKQKNLNTKTVERGSKLVYQVWLDTTKFDAANKDNIQTVGISDNYDEAKLNLNAADIKAYDSVTGAEVTDKFDITVNNGVITANLKDGFTKSLGDAENTQVIDTTKFDSDVTTSSIFQHSERRCGNWCRYRKYCGLKL